MTAALLIGSVLGWGISSYIAGRISKQATVASLMFWGSLVAFPLVVVPIAFGASFHPDPRLILWAGASFVSLFLAWILYLLALKEGDSSPAVVIASAYPLLSLPVFILLGASTFSLLLLLGIALIVLGVIVIGKHDGHNQPVSAKVILLSLATASAWGLWGVFDWKALQYGTPFDLMLWAGIISLLAPIIIFLWSRVKNVSIKIEKRETITWRFLSIFLSQMAALAFYFALEENHDDPEIIIALTATYPAVTMLLAIWRREEKLTLLRTLGLLAIIGGVAALQIYSG